MVIPTTTFQTPLSATDKTSEQVQGGVLIGGVLIWRSLAHWEKKLRDKVLCLP